MKIRSALVLAVSLLAAWPGLAADQPAAKAPLVAPASFQIRNKQFGDLLRPQDANHATGTPLVLHPAEAWKCMTWKITHAGETTFRLQNHFTLKTFGTRGDSKNAEYAQAVIQLPLENGGPAWAITRLDDGTFKIIQPQTGKALTARQDRNGSGVRVVLRPFTGTDSQKWELKQIDPKTLTM